MQALVESPFARELARAGLSLSEVQRRTGLCLSQLSRYAHNKISPRADVLPVLAAALGCDAACLIPPLDPARQRALWRVLEGKGVGSGEWGVGSGEWGVGSGGKTPNAPTLLPTPYSLLPSPGEEAPA